MANLADLVDYSVDDTPSILEIRSDRIEPIQSNASDRIYKFRLEPQGFLDRNSIFQFKLRKSASATGNDTEMRVSSFNGVLGGIKRCIFQVGDFILNDLSDVNEWTTLTQLAAERRTRLNKYHAHYLGNQFHTKISSTDDATFGQYQVDETES